MRQNKACKGAAGCLQRATSFTGAVLPTEEQCSKGHWQLPAGRGDCLLGGAVNYCPFTRVTMMFLFVFLPLSRGILAELLSIMLNNWQRRLSGKHLKLEWSCWQRQFIVTSVMFRLSVCLPQVCCLGHRITNLPLLKSVAFLQWGGNCSWQAAKQA